MKESKAKILGVFLLEKTLQIKENFRRDGDFNTQKPPPAFQN